MSNLRFEYIIYNIPGSNTFPLDQKAKAKFEAEKTHKFLEYIDRINACDGYYKVSSVSADGQTFTGNIVATLELLEEINLRVKGGAI